MKNKIGLIEIMDKTITKNGFYSATDLVNKVEAKVGKGVYSREYIYRLPYDVTKGRRKNLYHWQRYLDDKILFVRNSISSYNP